MKCRERLEQYLRDNGVSYHLYYHAPAYTAQAVAEREHVPGQMVAKVVIAVADGELVMLVVPASRRVDLAKVSALLNAREVRLATEVELAEAFPDCEIGAIPPFGNLYQMPVYVDETLQADPIIFIQPGEHTTALSLPYSDFARLVAPVVASFVAEHRREVAGPHNDIKEMGAW
ncbi:YbaK/EbsC family protein [Chloroflexus sp.]|uniref:aminoacyl-tRNA deacylase n=1 Tax=Chloroflexus sp. TaxID=1904827 RepID=UPI00298EDAC8|nr:YbaK/EbsC family protein [Chloroflexus sp.]MCX7860126.1 YbaK/EbsC family protein [Chloroflexus sp.]MDW8405175.1 YbaK/EbsC family protein [Chloroflexus sp.]